MWSLDSGGLRRRKLPGLTWRKRRLQESIVKCSEHDEVQITSRSFTSSDSISSHLDLVLPLCTVGSDERVRSTTLRNPSSLKWNSSHKPSVIPPFHISPFHSHVATGEQRSHGADGTGSCSRGPAYRKFRLLGRSPTESSSSGVQRPAEWLSRPL